MEHYPLEQVAIIKQKKLEEAERILKEKRAALEKEHEKLLSVEKERDEVKSHRLDKLSQLRETLDRASTSDKIQQMKQYLKVVDEKLKTKEHKVKEQLKQVDLAKAQVETARQEVMKRNQDVEKLRLHRKEWEEEMRRQRDLKESTESDEMGSVLHQHKKRPPRRKKNNQN